MQSREPNDANHRETFLTILARYVCVYKGRSEFTKKSTKGQHEAHRFTTVGSGNNYDRRRIV